MQVYCICQRDKKINMARVETLRKPQSVEATRFFAPSLVTLTGLANNQSRHSLGGVQRVHESHFHSSNNLLHELTDKLKLPHFHGKEDAAKIIKEIRYQEDGKTPRFGIADSIFFPETESDRRAAEDFFGSIQQPEKPIELNDCFGIKGRIGGNEEEVHFHGGFSGDLAPLLLLLADPEIGNNKAAQQFIEIIGDNTESLKKQTVEQRMIMVAEGILHATDKGDHHAHHHGYHDEHSHAEHEDLGEELSWNERNRMLSVAITATILGVADKEAQEAASNEGTGWGSYGKDISAAASQFNAERTKELHQTFIEARKQYKGLPREKIVTVFEGMHEPVNKKRQEKFASEFYAQGKMDWEAFEVSVTKRFGDRELFHDIAVYLLTRAFAITTDPKYSYKKLSPKEQRIVDAAKLLNKHNYHFARNTGEDNHRGLYHGEGIRIVGGVAFQDPCPHHPPQHADKKMQEMTTRNTQALQQLAKSSGISLKPNVLGGNATLINQSPEVPPFDLRVRAAPHEEKGKGTENVQTLRSLFAEISTWKPNKSKERTSTSPVQRRSPSDGGSDADGPRIRYIVHEGTSRKTGISTSRTETGSSRQSGSLGFHHGASSVSSLSSGERAPRGVTNGGINGNGRNGSGEVSRRYQANGGARGSRSFTGRSSDAGFSGRTTGSSYGGGERSGGGGPKSPRGTLNPYESVGRGELTTMVAERSTGSVVEAAFEEKVADGAIARMTEGVRVTQGVTRAAKQRVFVDRTAGTGAGVLEEDIQIRTATGDVVRAKQGGAVSSESRGTGATAEEAKTDSLEGTQVNVSAPVMKTAGEEVGSDEGEMITDQMSGVHGTVSATRSSSAAGSRGGQHGVAGRNNTAAAAVSTGSFTASDLTSFLNTVGRNVSPKYA